MNTSPKSTALTMNEAAKFVGVDYRTTKREIKTRTISTLHLCARLIVPRAEPLRVFEVDVNRLTA
jgi:hypothetical protein